VQRYETKAGYQAQVDWKICGYVDLNGEVRMIPVFAVVLGYSRVMYIEFTKRCDIHSFLRCMLNTLEYFGGVPKTMLTDQMKTVIRSKRSVQSVEQNFMPGRQFTDLGDLNRQARQWCDEQNRRIHGTIGERQVDRLGQEILGSLPTTDRLAKCRFEPRKASHDGLAMTVYVTAFRGGLADVTEGAGNERFRRNFLRLSPVTRSSTDLGCWSYARSNMRADLSTAQGYAYPTVGLNECLMEVVA